MNIRSTVRSLALFILVLGSAVVFGLSLDSEPYIELQPEQYRIQSGVDEESAIGPAPPELQVSVRSDVYSLLPMAWVGGISLLAALLVWSLQEVPQSDGRSSGKVERRSLWDVLRLIGALLVLLAVMNSHLLLILGPIGLLLMFLSNWGSDRAERAAEAHG